METNFPLFSELAKSEILRFEFYAIFLRNDDIIQLQIKDNFDCELKDSMHIVDCIKQLSNGKKYPILAIYSNFNSFSKEANAFVAKHKFTTADALVGKGVAFKILGNFYLRVNKPVRPTRLFNEIEPAVKWLEKYKPSK